MRRIQRATRSATPRGLANLDLCRDPHPCAAAFFGFMGVSAALVFASALRVEAETHL